MPVDIRDQVDTFFSSYKEITYPKGQLLLLPGDLTDKVYYLETGRISVYDVSYRGDEIVLYTFMPNSYFPMASVINKATNKFFYKTDTEAKMRIAPASDFNVFITGNTEMSYHLLSRAYARFEYILEKMLRLISGSARSRLIYQLVVEYEMYGVGDEKSGYLDTSESSIASKAGLSRETVSREMRHLKDAGLAQVKDRKIFINDFVRLRAMLDSKSN